MAHQNAKRPRIAKKDNQCKKVMHAIFVTPNGLAIQVFIPKGPPMSTRFYRKKFLENFSNSTRNVGQRQASVIFICYMAMPQVTRPEV